MVERYSLADVQYIYRLFYLRRWKELHGSYPYPLDYEILRGLMAIATEVQLREQYEFFAMKQAQDNEMQLAKMKQNQTHQYGKVNTF